MIFFVAIIVLTAAVWGAVYVNKTGLLGVSLAVLVTGCCFGHPFFHTSLGPLPITIDRLLLVGLVALFAIYLARGWIGFKRLTAADYLLIAFVGYIGVSTFVHDWKFDHAQPVAKLISFYLMPLAIYGVARQIDWTGRGVLGVLGFLTAIGIYFAATGVAEQQQLYGLVFPRYIASPKVVEFFGRARGPLLNPIGTGIVLVTALAAISFWWPRAGAATRMVLLGLLAIVLAGTYCTLTRSVWMSVVAAGGLMILAVLPSRFRLPFSLAACCLCLVLVGASWSELASFKRDQFVSVEDMSKSARLRPILAMVAWQMFQDQPLVGCGFGQYPQTHIYYLGDRQTDLPLEQARPYVQHNVFLSLLTETGLIGAGLLVLVIACWCKSGWQLWQQNEVLWVRQAGLLLLVTLSAYVVNGLFHDVSIIAMVHMVLFFLAGMAEGVRAMTCSNNVATVQHAARPLSIIRSLPGVA